MSILLRLPDVKPPCLNSPGTLVPGVFFGGTEYAISSSGIRENCGGGNTNAECRSHIAQLETRGGFLGHWIANPKQ